MAMDLLSFSAGNVVPIHPNLRVDSCVPAQTSPSEPTYPRDLLAITDVFYEAGLDDAAHQLMDDYEQRGDQVLNDFIVLCGSLGSTGITGQTQLF